MNLILGAKLIWRMITGEMEWWNKVLFKKYFCGIQNSDGLPKINIFCWIMVHGKLITTENLQKRETQGPSRCALCRVEEEMICHLFFECFFLKLVWQATFAGINH
jgi:hypothetical protein